MTCQAKLRTVQQCLIEIKSVDKDSAISEWFIRSLCKSNKINYIANGTKILVNLNSLINYLNNGYVEAKTVNQE